MVWIKIWESHMVDETLTNKEIEGKDYVEIIDEIGLSKENWEKLKQVFPGIKLEDLKKYEEWLPEEIKEKLPEEITYDSDCDGYDACWINNWYVNNSIVIFEQYFNSVNKYYGQYYPNAKTTLEHVLIVFKRG